jgi:hypothetical protein
LGPLRQVDAPKPRLHLLLVTLRLVGQQRQNEARSIVEVLNVLFLNESVVIFTSAVVRQRPMPERSAGAFAPPTISSAIRMNFFSFSVNSDTMI